MAEASRFKHLENFLPFLVEGLDLVLDNWAASKKIQLICLKRNISPTEIIEVMGIRILYYTFEIIEQTESLQYCPYADQLVEFFDKNGVKINEIFLFYMDLQRQVIQYVFENVPSSFFETQNILLELSEIFEFNLSDVLDIFFELKKSKIIEQSQQISFEQKVMEDYKTIVDDVNTVVVTDPDGFITYVNDKYCETSGYARASLIGRSVSKVRHPDSTQEQFEDIWSTIKEKRIWSGEIKNINKDGTTFYMQSTIAPIFDKDGTIKEYMALQHDVTKEKEQEHELNMLKQKEENDRITSLIESQDSELLKAIPMPAFLFNSAHVLQEFNEVFVDLFDFIDHADIMDDLKNRRLDLVFLLDESSRKRFEKFPDDWVGLYSTLYDGDPLFMELEVEYEMTRFEIRLTELREGKTLVCLVKV